MVDLGEGIFLSPKRSVLPKLVAEIEELREEYNVTLEELGIDGSGLFHRSFTFALLMSC